MSSPLENLNNAIVQMDFVARGMRPTTRTKQAVDLGDRWADFMESQRSYAGEVFDLVDLTRFWNRYTQVYALLPSEVQPSLVHPAKVDPSFSKLVEATVVRAVDANQAAAGAVADVADKAVDNVTKLALLAVVVLLAYGYAKR